MSLASLVQNSLDFEQERDFHLSCLLSIIIIIIIIIIVIISLINPDFVHTKKHNFSVIC